MKLQKKWKNNIGNAAINGALRGVGAVSAAFLSKKLFKRGGVTNSSKTLYNLHAPALLAAATFGDLVLTDEKVRSFCQGVQAFSFLKAIAVVAPSFGENVGLSGLSDDIYNYPVISGVDSDSDNTLMGNLDDGNDWNAVADELEAEDLKASMSGVDDPEDAEPEEGPEEYQTEEGTTEEDIYNYDNADGVAGIDETSLI